MHAMFSIGITPELAGYSFVRVMGSLFPLGSAGQCYTYTTFHGSYYPQETANFESGSPVGCASMWLARPAWLHDWVMLDVILIVDGEQCRWDNVCLVLPSLDLFSSRLVY